MRRIGGLLEENGRVGGGIGAIIGLEILLLCSGKRERELQDVNGYGQTLTGENGVHDGDVLVRKVRGG